MDEITRRSLLGGIAGAALAPRPLLGRTPFGASLGPAAGPMPAFIDKLIARMSDAEKAGQLSLVASAIGGAAAMKVNPAALPKTSDQQLAAARAGEITGVFNGAGAEWLGLLQKAAVESRLKIPLLFAGDVIHGFRTVFPVPLAEAASFDTDLARRTARATAAEAAAAGLAWTFAPMVDVARDARWGRSVEGSGEDVLLGRRMARARVEGFQGAGLDRPDALLACAKHFAGYGAAEGGLDYNSVDLSERTLREIYLPPFREAFAAGAITTMAAFNELSGIPSTANAWLLTEVLRGEWNFRGVVVSDYTGVQELVAHGFAKDERDAAKLAFLAGVDIDMQSGLYVRHLPGLVKSGEVPRARLDQAVRRVLYVKHRLGLFDDPFGRLSGASGRAGAPLDRPLARDAAQRSIVMLKNDGELLPLPFGGRIALIGPFAQGQRDLVGPWTVFGSDNEAVDLATGIRAAAGDAALVTVVAGCGVEKTVDNGIADAVAAARAADVVILALGEATRMSGEAASRPEPVLPDAQQRLAEAVAATGKPVVVVLKNGRALALGGAVLAAQAILVTWFLGTETGHAIADILFGKAAPSARLPVSFPRTAGQAPFHYDHKPTGRPNSPGRLQAFKTHYLDIPNSAMFPFGHGLTFGKIRYSDLSLGSGRLEGADVLRATATIVNEGRRAAEEVVQLYIRDRAASVTQPVRRLIDFRRVPLGPGARAEVAFAVRREDLLFIGQNNRPVVEPGMFDLWISPSSGDGEGLWGSFELV